MSDGSVEQETTSKPPVIRQKANDASEARLLIRQMQRIPAWKLKLCSEALNAKPTDHVRITEVTKIQFAKDELINVAVQCLVDIAKESESVTSSVEVASAALAATSQNDKEPEYGQAPPEPDKEPEGTEDVSRVQTAKDDSHKQADGQRATTQSASKPTSSTPVLAQDATASLEKSTSEHDDESGQDWVTRFL